jgi:hypothetical protein
MTKREHNLVSKAGRGQGRLGRSMPMRLASRATDYYWARSVRWAKRHVEETLRGAA